jgi:GT2 family glycosyltransferase
MAHRDPYPLIGGAVCNANPESVVSWAAYFCEFSIWLPAGRPRTMVDIPTCCLSMKRWLFEKCGPFLEASYCSDTVFNWRAGATGFPPRFLPSVRVSHINIDQCPRFIRKMRMHGGTFGRVRVAARALSRLQAGLLALGAPLLPLLLYTRILRRVLRSPAFAWPLLRATPLVLIGLIAWSWGEGVAYASKACRG